MKTINIGFQFVLILVLAIIMNINTANSQEKSLIMRINGFENPPNDTICIGDHFALTGSATGGPTPITYPNPRWTGSGAPFLSSLTTPVTIFTATVSGSFDVTYSAYDGNMIFYSVTQKIIVDVLQPLNIVSPSGGSATVCSNTPITLTVSGATYYYWYANDCSGGPYNANYFATGPSVSVTPTLPGPCKYKVEAFGPLGCPTSPPSREFTITVVEHPTANAGPDQTICAHSNALLSGSIGGSATMGSWTTSGTGTFVPNQNTLNATYVPGAADIACGSVTLTLTTDDPPGICPPASDFMILTINPDIANNIICCNQSICSGSVPSLITGTLPVGGYGTYNYQWQNSTVGVGGPFANIAGATGQNYQSPILLVDTWYRRIVTSPPCSANSISNVVFIDYSPLLVANAGNDTIMCGLQPTVDVHLGGSPTAYGGNPPCTYQWSSSPPIGPIPPQPNPIVTVPTSITSITFTVIVTDASNCISSDYMVVVMNTLRANAGGDMHICNGNNGGSAMLGGTPSASGGTPPYTYEWTAVPAYNWNPPGDRFLANPIVRPIVTTQFTLQVTDANNCIASDNVIVTVDPELFASAGPDQNINYCPRTGAKIGGLPPNRTAWGGTPFVLPPYYLFNWSSVPIDVSLIGQETLPNPRVKPSVNTTYYVTVTDAVSCRSYDTVIVSTDLPADFFNISTGLSEVDNIYNLQLYPNPTEGKVLLNMDDYSGTLEINIRNIQGKLLFSENIIVNDKSLNANIDLTKYSNGVYFIQVITDNNASIHKIIKQ